MKLHTKVPCIAEKKQNRLPTIMFQCHFSRYCYHIEQCHNFLPTATILTFMCLFYSILIQCFYSINDFSTKVVRARERKLGRGLPKPQGQARQTKSDKENRYVYVIKVMRLNKEGGTGDSSSGLWSARA